MRPVNHCLCRSLIVAALDQLLNERFSRNPLFHALLDITFGSVIQGVWFEERFADLDFHLSTSAPIA